MGQECEQAPGAGDGQQRLVSYSQRGRKESDRTERPNWTETISGDFCLFVADHVAFQSEKASSKSINILNMTSAPRLLNVPPSWKLPPPLDASGDYEEVIKPEVPPNHKGLINLQVTATLHTWKLKTGPLHCIEILQFQKRKLQGILQVPPQTAAVKWVS